MTFSPLTTRTTPDHGKHSSRAGRAIERVIVHHWAGVAGGDARLMNPAADVSANYILYGDGTLVGQVPETHRAWTSGSWEVDSPSITIEVQNSAVGGEWPVTDTAVAALVALIADIAVRYGWGSVTRARVRGHREFAATACPGQFLWSRLDSIAAAAEQRRQGSQPAPVTPGDPTGDLDAIARAVIRGDYGNGDERRRRLGNNYAAVQTRVNELLNVTAASVQPAADLDAIARAVIRGDYGNGAERQANLGDRYHDVQHRVNEILGLA